MTELLFYHLQNQAIERVLPPLLEKTLARGWRAVVQCASEERVEALDAHLWTYRDDAFLPHGTHREAVAADQPVLITVQDDNPNGAAVRFLVDGASIPADPTGYERLVLIFDGEDEEALRDARARWVAAKAAGLVVTYWQADENGRWSRKG
jgi:DNA polymerase-3 subunit chi